MKNIKSLLWLIFILAAPSLFAQPGSQQIVVVTSTPTGSCGGVTPLRITSPGGLIYACQGGTWAQVGSGGGSGTVTEVIITGTSTDIVPTGTCDITTTGTCNLDVGTNIPKINAANVFSMVQTALGWSTAGNITTGAAAAYRFGTTSSQFTAPSNGQIQCQNNATAACQFIANSIVSKGTTFTTSGCSVSATTGGGSAGIFTLGANTCTAVITINGATGSTAPNGWACTAADRTAPLILISQTASSATTASFSIPATAGATDVIQFACTGY